MCSVQLKALVAPVYSGCPEQNITCAVPGTICNGNQLHPQTFYTFSVLVSTLLTPNCMGTSFRLLAVRVRVCSSLLAHGPLHPSMFSVGWSSLSKVSMCKWYNPLWCWHGLSSAPFLLSLSFPLFLLSSSCMSFPVLLCNFSPSLSNNQHHTPVHQTEIQRFLIIHKSCLGVTCPNLLSWKPHRPAALSLQLFATSVFYVSLSNCLLRHVWLSSLILSVS